VQPWITLRFSSRFGDMPRSVGIAPRMGIARRSEFVHILVVSDLHGDLGSAHRALKFVQPDLMLSCGDWGDPDQVDEIELAGLLKLAPVHTTFGNHDPLDLLARLKNRDGSAVLLPQGKPTHAGGLRLAAIGGIWAKSHAKRHYVTDADVAQAAASIAQGGPVDILITHGCPVGLADLTPSGRHGGQRCFLDAFKTISPRLHLCGHLHLAQERTLKSGQRIINAGQTPAGSIVVVDFDATSGTLTAALEQLPER
jgi:Icc-related predicted phosphoesterase